MNLDEAKREIEKQQAIADGWRTIGATMLGAAFGMEYRCEELPPVELIDALGTGLDAVDNVSAAILGRAYRFFADGDDAGKAHTECSYPLCPNRGTERPMTEVTLSQPDKLTTRARVCAWIGEAGAAGSECERWAQWIACRVAAGRVKLVP